MNTFVIDGSWNQIKGRLRQQYGALTDDDLTFAEGKSEEMLGRLQTKLGLDGAEFDSLLAKLKAGVEDEAKSMKVRYANVKTKAAEIAGDVKLRAGEVADDVREAAAAKADELRMQANEAYKNARLRAYSLREDGEEYVRHNPREALLTAFAAGFVLGLLWRR